MAKVVLPGQAPFVPGRRIPLAAFAERLYAAYGPQGWWPLLEHRGSNPTLTGRLTGYHPGDYSFPRTEAQRFEICCGAILTQNTAWLNVEKALQTLAQQGLLAPRKILVVDEERLQQAIRPSGYFRAKARKLRAFCEFYRRLSGRPPSREQLLQVWGVGPETADSILLYAYAQIEMVVDVYTLRVLLRHGYQRREPSYAAAKAYCERSLPRSLTDYQEFHALMVEHAKRLRAAELGASRTRVAGRIETPAGSGPKSHTTP